MFANVKGELEQILDSHSLTEILGMLVELCHLKAEHVQWAWQHKSLAESWLQDARILSRALSKLQN